MSEELRLIELADSWTLSHTDFLVTRCMVDYAFSIVLLGETHVTVVIENDFIFKANGKASTISVADTKTLGEVLAILHKPLGSIKIYKTGQIELHIDRFEIIVAPDLKYEAWQITSDNGLLIVCTPGGDLAIWLPK